MKKGFTLIELLAVIIILGIIALVSIPIALNTIKQSKKDLFDKQIALIESGARTFATESVYKKSGYSGITDYYFEIYQLTKGNVTEVAVPLYELQSNGNLTYDINNPLCNDSKAKYFDPENVIIEYKYNGKEFEINIYHRESPMSGLKGLEDSCTKSNIN